MPGPSGPRAAVHAVWELLVDCDHVPTLDHRSMAIFVLMTLQSMGCVLSSPVQVRAGFL